MVKTRQVWVLLSPLELLAVEAVGGVTSASAVGGVAPALAVSAAPSAVGGVVSAVVGEVASALAAVASAAVSMAFADPEVVYPAAEDVTSSMGAPTVATWAMAAGTLWGSSWVGLGFGRWRKPVLGGRH
eukprot:g14496.t1